MSVELCHLCLLFVPHSAQRLVQTQVGRIAPLAVLHFVLLSFYFFERGFFI